jgi:hypothetical protein
MQRFKSPEQAQRFLETFSAVCNQFRPRRHRLTATSYRLIMRARFEQWRASWASRRTANSRRQRQRSASRRPRQPPVQSTYQCRTRKHAGALQRQPRMRRGRGSLQACAHRSRCCTAGPQLLAQASRHANPHDLTGSSSPLHHCALVVVAQERFEANARAALGTGFATRDEPAECPQAGPDEAAQREFGSACTSGREREDFGRPADAEERAAQLFERDLLFGGVQVHTLQSRHLVPPERGREHFWTAAGNLRSRLLATPAGAA